MQIRREKPSKFYNVKSNKSLHRRILRFRLHNLQSWGSGKKRIGRVQSIRNKEMSGKIWGFRVEKAEGLLSFKIL